MADWGKSKVRVSKDKWNARKKNSEKVLSDKLKENSNQSKLEWINAKR